MKVAILCALAGCASQTNAGGPWTDAAAITGELAPELGPPAAASALPCTLRMATWNVHFAPDPDALAAALLASPELATIDVLVVQEIRAFPDEPATRAARLAHALGPQWTWIYAPARTIDGGTHGLGMFSRYPLLAPQIRELPYFAQVLHPEQRIALTAQLDPGDGTPPIQIVDVHLDVRLAAADRIRQLDPAVNDLGDALLVGGDLNTTPWEMLDTAVPLTSTEAVTGADQAAIVDRFMHDIGFSGAIDPETETFPFPGTTIRLDNLYTRGRPLLAAAVEHVAGSDHWPLWFDVSRCVSAATPPARTSRPPSACP